MLSAVLLLAMLAPSRYASAAPGDLTASPLTWDVIGLDSNSPDTDGPDTFPVGARICNETTASQDEVTTTFAFEAGASANFTLANGVAAATNLGTVAAGECVDSYYLVRIDRSTPAGDTAPYTITAMSAQGNVASTPAGRQLYVEDLVSQNRNDVDSISGDTTVYTGQQYTYTLEASTATNGYEQLETYLTLSNTIFRIIDVDVSFTAPAGATNDAVYADACGWDADPASDDYLSCVGPALYGSGKAGGRVVMNYTVEVVGTGTNVLTAMIYDFSGSSFHYNSDYGDPVEALFVEAFPSTDLSIDIEPVGPFQAATTDALTVAVTNEGTDFDTDGTLTASVDLPLGITFRSASGSGWSCAAAAGTVTCTTSDPLAVGATSTITIDVDVTAPDGTEVTVGAVISTDGSTNDTNAGNDTDSARITVASSAGPINTPPVAANDAASTAPGVPVEIAVLDNDSDADGDPLTVVIDSQPANGTATTNGTTVTYTPDDGFTGVDSFDYEASDDNDGAATATVSLTVEPQQASAPSPRTTATDIAAERDGALPAAGGPGSSPLLVALLLLACGVGLLTRPRATP